MGRIPDLGGALGSDRPYPKPSPRPAEGKVADVQLNYVKRHHPEDDTNDANMRVDVKRLLGLMAKKAVTKYNNARDAFRYLDGNGDGAVSRSEVRYFFRTLNMNAEDADIVFDYLKNDVEDIDYATFVQCLWPFIAPECGRPRDKARIGSEDAPRTLDNVVAAATNDARTQDSRRVFRGQLGAAVQHVRQQMQTKFRNTRSAFRAVDVNKDGQVSRQEMRLFLAQFGYYHLADELFDEMSQGNEVDYQRFLTTFDVHAGNAPTGSNNGQGPLGQVVEDRELDREIKEIARALGNKLYTKFNKVAEAFRFLDIDKDGTISIEELDSFFLRMCIPTDASRKVFKALGEENASSVKAKKFYTLFGPVIA